MWFTEGIAKALNKSRNDRLTLLVYLQGENDQSNEMTNLLETDESIKEVIRTKTIALKLTENSENAKMLHSVYPVKPSPTVYLISHLGALLDTFSDKLDKESFIQKLNDNANLIDQTKASSSNVEAQTELDNNRSNQPINKSIEEKKRELLEKVRAKNKKEEEERTKNKEMQRIKSGKELGKLRKQHEEQEILDSIKEREKDAIFDKIERERVLRAIEEDNLEKKARFELERIKREEEYKKIKSEKSSTSIKNRVIKLEENEIRIQFKLPDASSLITKFKIDQTLQDAVDYLKENSDLKNFQLAITYPKRNFTEQDFSTKFVDLGIKNSVVFLVVEISSGSSSTSKVENYSIFNQSWQMLLSFYTILFSIFAGLIGSLFGVAQTNASTSGPATSQSDSAKASSSKLTDDKNNFKSFKIGHDDDRTNTYNGNSTEQQ